ncbi:MAG: disulfide bond formation protein B [Gammaproteobacteria bacterium]|nr:disulfide bond formation protein B [Gammaproteobacteria bacterium]
MSIRSLYLSGFALVALLLAFSIYLQVVDGIMPCPLCTLQRFTFGLLGLTFFLGIVIAKSKWGRHFTNALLVFWSSLGLFLAGRQIWLQQYGNAESNECGVSLQYMLQVLPFDQVMQRVFAGSAECTQRGWEFLHLNMAEWASICFGFFLCMSLYLLFKAKKS